jgi:hypothetical protein
MDFLQKMQEGFNKGMASSRELLAKAKDKVQELGEKGVLKLEILHLEDQAGKLMGKLGAHVYESFSGGKSSLKRTGEVDTLVTAIEDIKKQIDEKEKLSKSGS